MKRKGSSPPTPDLHLASSRRAIKTLNLALEAMGRLWLPVTERSWKPQRAPLWRPHRPRQGRDRGEAWRRSGQDLAPQLRHPAAAARGRLALGPGAATSRYKPASRFRQAESLKDTIERVLPYWEEPRSSPSSSRRQDGADRGARQFSLRALVKHLSGISDADIAGLEIPTGQPIVYELADDLSARQSATTSASGNRPRHCEERSDAAIQGRRKAALDCFASLAMTAMDRLKASPSRSTGKTARTCAAVAR
jgi:2,3-bisphosphoglycerate-dependent phosphoglycerate mutase